MLFKSKTTPERELKTPSPISLSLQLATLKSAKPVLGCSDLDSDSQLIYLSLLFASTVKGSPLPDLLELAQLLEIEPNTFLTKFSSLVERQFITLHKRYEAGQIVDYYELSTPTPQLQSSKVSEESLNRSELIQRTRKHFCD